MLSDTSTATTTFGGIGCDLPIRRMGLTKSTARKRMDKLLENTIQVLLHLPKAHGTIKERRREIKAMMTKRSHLPRFIS
jgi:hypothetical protein